MPTYEYACTECGNEWEAEQSIKDAALTQCPKCHAEKAKRQISRGAGFILKGGGWYSDLYSSPSNKSADKESKSGDKETSKSESKGEGGGGKSDSGSSGASGSGSSPPGSSSTSGSSASAAA
jgi:putative FmdB family regulatory protein